MQTATGINKRACGGFSLIELLVTTTLLMIIFSGVAGFMVVVNRQFVTQRVRLRAINNGEVAADAIVRLVRMSSSRPNTCSSGFVVPDVLPQAPITGEPTWYARVRVRSDWNPADCDLSDVEEDVTISATGNSLYLDSSQVTPFVGNIRDIRFRFYNQSGAVMSSPESQTASISMVLVRITTIADDGATTTLNSQVSLRN